MKSAIYALLCFIFIIPRSFSRSGSNMMTRCRKGFPGSCFNAGKTPCEDAYSRSLNKTARNCRCIPADRQRLCYCDLSKC
uniref:S locus protein 11-Sx n=1 Tax=Brassica campestris TaxID=3711 RepID=D7US53_BRACM|nr:S locus protein 11-Sx [Brassica rapa]